MRINNKVAQAAIEYVLLLAVVVAIVLLGLPAYIPRVNNAANVYFSSASNAILGPPPRCGDGLCTFGENNERCCRDCGPTFC